MSYKIAIYLSTTSVGAMLGIKRPANTLDAEIKHKNFDLTVLVCAVLALAVVELLRKFILSEGSYTTAKMVIWSAFAVIALPYIIWGGSELAAKAKGCMGGR